MKDKRNKKASIIRHEPKENLFRQGKILEGCKGCVSHYLGYCLSFPFNKPVECSPFTLK